MLIKDLCKGSVWYRRSAKMVIEISDMILGGGKWQQ